MDRVREALFSILADSVRDAVVLDLYAGSGSLGLEALSRGATEVCFVDRAHPAVECLQTNITRVGSEECAILPMPVDRALARLVQERMKFDLVFLDPPYYKGLVPRTLEQISRIDILSSRARIVAEHESKLEAPSEVGSLFRIDTRRYGDTSVSIYSPFLAQE